MKSTKTLEELFRPETKWESIKYFFPRLFYHLEDKFHSLMASIQRGKRGYADCDVWDFDYYLTGVILGGLKLLKKNRSGHPISLTDKEWDKILNEMIEGFEEYKILCDNDEINLKKEKKTEAKLKNSLLLFAEWFLSLWD